MEEQIVEDSCIPRVQGVQFVRQSEHDMEIRDGEDFPFPSGDPALAGLRLAFRAVAITTGIIGHAALVATARTGIDVATECRCAAAGDRAQHGQLLVAEPASLTVKAIVLRAE